MGRLNLRTRVHRQYTRIQTALRSNNKLMQLQYCMMYIYTEHESEVFVACARVSYARRLRLLLNVTPSET